MYKKHILILEWKVIFVQSRTMVIKLKHIRKGIVYILHPTDRIVYIKAFVKIKYGKLAGTSNSLHEVLIQQPNVP